MSRTKARRAAAKDGKEPLTARLTPEDIERVRAFGERVGALHKMTIGPCTAAAMLIREGLEAVEGGLGT